MTSEARAALREKVVKALDETFLQASRRGMWNVSLEYDCAVAVIDVVLEEAARVAADDGHSHACNCEYCYGREQAAAAIQAMKGKD